MEHQKISYTWHNKCIWYDNINIKYSYVIASFDLYLLTIFCRYLSILEISPLATTKPSFRFERITVVWKKTLQYNVLRTAVRFIRSTVLFELQWDNLKCGYFASTAWSKYSKFDVQHLKYRLVVWLCLKHALPQFVKS